MSKTVNGVPTMAALYQWRQRLGISREKVVRRLDPPLSVRTLERWELTQGKDPGEFNRRRLSAVYRTLELEASEQVA